MRGDSNYQEAIEDVHDLKEANLKDIQLPQIRHLLQIRGLDGEVMKAETKRNPKKWTRCVIDSNGSMRMRRSFNSIFRKGELMEVPQCYFTPRTLCGWTEKLVGW